MGRPLPGAGGRVGGAPGDLLKAHGPMNAKRLLFCLAVAACGEPAPPAVSVASPAAPASLLVASPEARAVVAAPDRTDADRQLDAGRHPAELLTFLGVKPGMRVAELVAGAGYTAELLARAVAPGGAVYAENPRYVLAGSGELWSARLATPAAKDIVRVDRELDAPLPPEAKDLDLVLVNLVYHDTQALGVDRQKMNRGVLSALRSGGRYVIIDHSARPGVGFADAGKLHRVDEKTVREEVEGVGFHLESEGTFLRNPADGRDWNASPQAAAKRRGTSDRFALVFVK
jgi:predicted methyltransferase